jgi:hypothetical protein
LQAAYGNAVGARSGGNTAVQAALSELLKQTTLAGQQQIGQLQSQNQQTQAQAGGAIANATKGTTQTVQSKSPGQAKELASIIALTQAALKLTGSKDLGELGQKMGMWGTPAQTTAPVQGQQAAMPQAQAPIMSAQAPQMSMAPWATGGTAALLGGAGASGGGNSGLGGMVSSDAGLPVDWIGGMSMAPNMGGTTIANILGTPAPQMSMAPSQPVNIMDYFGPAQPAADMGGGMSFDSSDWEQYF